jgi:DNA-binding transcriptional regulator YhcF (GntR family)
LISQRALASMHGVSPATISRVQNRQSLAWR